MADLFTHALAGYVLATLLSFRYPWITPRYVTLAMVGAIIPDLNRMSLVIPEYVVEGVLGIPFSWFAIHSLGGVLVASAVGALAIGERHRHRVFALLLLGALSHLVLDALLMLPSGYSPPMWWPFTEQRLPTPGLYMSYYRWPLVVAGGIAAGVWYLRARIPRE